MFVKYPFYKLLVRFSTQNNSGRWSFLAQKQLKNWTPDDLELVLSRTFDWSNEIHFTVTWKCFIIYHLKDDHVTTLNAFYFRTGWKVLPRVSSAGSPNQRKFPNSSKRTSMFIPLRFYYLQLSYDIITSK